MLIGRQASRRSTLYIALFIHSIRDGYWMLQEFYLWVARLHPSYRYSFCLLLSPGRLTSDLAWSPRRARDRQPAGRHRFAAACLVRACALPGSSRPVQLIGGRGKRKASTLEPLTTECDDGPSHLSPRRTQGKRTLSPRATSILRPEVIVLSDPSVQEQLRREKAAAIGGVCRAPDNGPLDSAHRTVPSIRSCRRPPTTPQ